MKLKNNIHFLRKLFKMVDGLVIVLNPSNLRKDLKKLIRNVKKRTITITLAGLIALNSFFNSSAVASVSKETNIQVRGAVELIQFTANKVGQKIPVVKDRNEFEKRLRAAIESIAKDVDNDINEQRYFECLKPLETLSLITEVFDMQEEYAKVNSLITKINSSFYLHINFVQEGVYTLKGQKTIYVIAKVSSSGKVMIWSQRRPIVESRVRNLLYGFVSDNFKIEKANLDMVQSVGSSYKDLHGNWWYLYEVYDIKLISDDGRVIEGKDIIKILELKGYFLPLK